MSPEFDRPRLVPAAPKGHKASLTMRAASSRRVIYVAIASNLASAACKYVAASVTGSSAMWAEAFRSTADSGNELLLRWGIRRSARPPDSLHPFGHGKVLYFYSLLVAVYIFGIGVLALRQGVVLIWQPEQLTRVGWNYSVLAAAFALDFYSWRISYKELLARKDPDETTWQEIIGSKDPTVFTIFLEDTAGMAGTVLALRRHFSRAYAGSSFFRCFGLDFHWPVACQRRGPVRTRKRSPFGGGANQSFKNPPYTGHYLC